MKKPDKSLQKDPYDLSYFKIMIVDDSQFIANLMASALRAMGVGKVLVARDLAEAKRMLLTYNAVASSQNIDVAIVDWLMPEGDGSELILWARQHKSDSIKFMPTIVCSAYTSTDVVEKARDCGSTEAMVKPVSAQKLANRILYVIDHPRPFIEAPSFFGPERRRKVERFVGEERRQTKKSDVEEDHEQLE
ncbi:MAG: response regulator [Rhodospirillales bacterium]|nr:response regulator [Rhodospirillales bacterium]